IGRAEIGLDRFGYVLDRYAELLRLDAIDIDEHLRRVRGKWRKHRSQARRLARRRDELVGGRSQEFSTAALTILDSHGETTARADAGNRGRWNNDNECALKAGQPL